MYDVCLGIYEFVGKVYLTHKKNPLSETQIQSLIKLLSNTNEPFECKYVSDIFQLKIKETNLIVITFFNVFYVFDL